MRSAAASSRVTRPTLAVIGTPLTASPSRALRRRFASSYSAPCVFTIDGAGHGLRQGLDQQGVEADLAPLGGGAHSTTELTRDPADDLDARLVGSQNLGTLF